MKTLFSKHPRVYKSRLIGLGPGPIVQTRRCIFLRVPRHETVSILERDCESRDFRALSARKGNF